MEKRIDYLENKVKEKGKIIIYLQNKMEENEKLTG